MLPGHTALACVAAAGLGLLLPQQTPAPQGTAAPRGTTAPRGPLDERPPWERLDRPSAEACGGCHARELAEWSTSLHGRAWTNANVRAATQDFQKVECRACHSPMPVFATGLAEAPDYRDFNQEDGVQCLACHGLADGVAAARTIEGAPCRPRAEPRLLVADHCYPCHQPTHHAFDEYRLSKAFAAGKRCADCHMPARAEGGGHSHGPNGGMNANFVQRAISWSAALEGGEVVLTVTNLTGHKFPGEIPSRSFLIRVLFAEHEPIELLLRKPHKGEAREDDRLTPDETRVLRFPLPDGVDEARVELTFLPLPLLPAEQGFSLGSWSSAR